MFATLFAVLLQAATAPAAAASAATPATAPPPTVAKAAVSIDEDTPTVEGLESLRQTYHDSCEVRLYGEYDDMCSALGAQIRRYDAALAKAKRKARAR